MTEETDAKDINVPKPLSKGREWMDRRGISKPALLVLTTQARPFLLCTCMSADTQYLLRSKCQQLIKISEYEFHNAYLTDHPLFTLFSFNLDDSKTQSKDQLTATAGKHVCFLLTHTYPL